MKTRRQSNEELESRLAAEEAKSTRYQIKTATTNVTGAVAALAFNNLEIGKLYRITQRHQTLGSGAAGHRMTTMNGAQQIALTRDVDPDGQGNGLADVNIFIATATTTVSTHTQLSGTSSVAYTIIIEELDEHELTSAWT